MFQEGPVEYEPQLQIRDWDGPKEGREGFDPKEEISEGKFEPFWTLFCDFCWQGTKSIFTLT